MTITHRLEALARGVLGPLVLGGPIHLVPPFGAKLALSIEGAPRIVDDTLRTSIDVARVRVARTVVPVDTLPDLPASDWALVAALNDLLQATNHHLSGPFTRGRHAALITAVEGLLERLGPPRRLADAVNRHASFSRITEVVRTDTKVTWWAGSASFRGEKPATRLFTWKELRRVRSDENTVHLADLPDGVGALKKDAWLAALALWFTRSPLTDIATLVRPVPAFAWSAPTLAFVSTRLGSTLAARALCAHASTGERRAKVAPALEASINHMPAGKAREIALRFAEEAVARLKGSVAPTAADPTPPPHATADAEVDLEDDEEAALSA